MKEIKILSIVLMLVLLSNCEMEDSLSGEHPETAHLLAEDVQHQRVSMIDQEKYKDRISIWNERIVSELESHGVDLDPWNVDEDFIRGNIAKLEQILEFPSVRDDFEVYVFAQGHLAGKYHRLGDQAHQDEKSEKAKALWEKSAEHSREVIRKLGEDPGENRHFLGLAYSNLAAVNQRTGRFDEAKEIIVMLVEEYQDVDSGAPYPRWFAVRFGVQRILGFSRDIIDDDEELERIGIKQRLAYLHEIAERYENEVGFYAAKNLHRYYFLTEQQQLAEEAYHQARYLLSQMDYDYLEERWNGQIKSKLMQREFERRGWDYAVN